MQNFNNDKYIYFHNNTYLPIMLGSWQDHSSQKKFIKIEPGEKRMVHSSEGQWDLDSMFHDQEDNDKWAEHFGLTDLGLMKYNIVGTFRCKPNYFGNYSCMEYEDIFQCVYSIVEDKENVHIHGLMTYSLVDHTSPFLK